MSEAKVKDITIKRVDTTKAYILGTDQAYYNLSKFGAKDPQGKALTLAFFQEGQSYRVTINEFISPKTGKTNNYIQNVISSVAQSAPAAVATTAVAPSPSYRISVDQRDLRMSKAGVLQAALVASATSGLSGDKLFPAALALAKQAFSELWNGEQEWK